MNYYVVEPEVAGGLGPSSIIEPGTHPPMIHRLECRFEGWLGSHIVESFPVFFVSDDLLKKLQRRRLTGFTEGNVVVTLSDEFRESSSARRMPSFKWLRIVGQKDKDDFFIADDQRLVVSENAKITIEGISTVNWEIELFTVTQE